MIRVVLVNAPPHTRVDRYDTPDFTRVSLVCLAAWVRDRVDVDVTIVDAKFERLSFGETAARICAVRPDVVGLTAFTNEIKSVARVARAVKAQQPGVVTVVGGPHVSALPVETLVEFPALDAGVVGEGEAPLEALLRAVGAGGSFAAIPGLVHREHGAPALAPGSSVNVAPSELPMPAWDMVPAGRHFLVSTQRGCPFHCNFCQNPAGRLVRQRPVAEVIAELEQLWQRHAPEEIIFCDEIFTVDLARTHRLLDTLIAAGLHRKLRWWAQTHVNLVDREVLAKMKAAGCYRCALGIETGDDETMKASRKGITRDRVLHARRLAAEVGMPIEGLFILGHPDETWDSAMQTIDFAVALNPEVPVFSTMVPYPGTRVAEMARRGEGGYRLLSTDWNDYLNQIGHSLAFDHLSRRKIELLQMLGYVKVFAANRRYGDLARFAWDYRSEGWAVARKVLSGRGPQPFDAE